MKLNEVKDVSKRVVVVYGGRFEPPHPGHLGVYKWLVDKFGVDNVYVAMSARTNLDPSKGDLSPFTFDERKEIWTKLFKDGPVSEKVVQTKDPTFNPKEILEDKKGAVYVSAVSEKDVARYEKSKFFRPYPEDGKRLHTYEEGICSYYVMVPMQKDSLSSTQVRAMLGPKVSDKKAKSNFDMIYGKLDKPIYKMMRERLSMVEKKDDESKSD